MINLDFHPIRKFMNKVKVFVCSYVLDTKYISVTVMYYSLGKITRYLSNICLHHTTCLVIGIHSNTFSCTPIPSFSSTLKKVPIHRRICITQVYPKSIWRLLFCICAKYQRFLPIRNHTMAKHNFQSKIKWDFFEVNRHVAEFWTK